MELTLLLHILSLSLSQVEGAFYSYASPTPTNTDPYTVAYSPGKPNESFAESTNEHELHDLDLILRLFDIVAYQLHLDHLSAYHEDLWEVQEKRPVYSVLAVCSPPPQFRLRHQERRRIVNRACVCRGGSDDRLGS